MSYCTYVTIYVAKIVLLYLYQCAYQCLPVPLAVSVPACTSTRYLYLYQYLVYLYLYQYLCPPVSTCTSISICAYLCLPVPLSVYELTNVYLYLYQ